MRERRRHRRRALWRHGLIAFDGADGPTTAKCLVKDISVAGAQLIMLTPGEVPVAFRLSVDGIVGQGCSVKWRDEDALGVEFDLPF